jgi:hypothetical protein
MNDYAGGVPKGRDFDNPRRQPGGIWSQDHVAPTGRYVVQPYRPMRRFWQTRYHIVFRTRAQRMFFPMMPLRVTPRWGYQGWDAPPCPPADAGGYRNRVPSGRLQCALALRLDGFSPLLIAPQVSRRFDEIRSGYDNPLP